MSAPQLPQKGDDFSKVARNSAADEESGDAEVVRLNKCVEIKLILMVSLIPITIILIIFGLVIWNTQGSFSDSPTPAPQRPSPAPAPDAPKDQPRSGPRKPSDESDDDSLPKSPEPSDSILDLLGRKINVNK